MGMLDQPTPFSEQFSEGQPFVLEDAKKSADITTDYGTGPMALFKIEGKWFSLFGQTLLSQIDRMDDDDRRAMRNGTFRVKVCRGKTRKDQPMKVLVPADTQCSPNGELTGDDDIPF